MHVVLLGPPGVGKGTAASLLAQKTGLPHISTGNMFRDEMQKGTALGTQVGAYVNTGRLVPDELVTAVVRSQLAAPAAAKGFFLDGYPRTIAQAQALQTFSTVDVALNFIAPKKTLIARITKRRTIDQSGRADDHPELILRRIAEHENKTAPLIDFYRNEGVLRDVDATLDVEQVVRQCETILKTVMA